MLMSLCLVLWMLMIVRPVFSGVFMFMNFGPLAVAVFMKMLVRMLVGMCMRMVV
jgi:hypothetical protein